MALRTALPVLALVLCSACGGSRAPAPAAPPPPPPSAEEELEEEELEEDDEIDDQGFEVSQLPSQEEIQDRIRENLSRIQRCFTEDYRRTKVLCPTVELEWDLEPDGSVSGVEASSSGGSPSLHACLRTIAETWSFSPHDRSTVRAHYPLRLQCSGS